MATANPEFSKLGQDYRLIDKDPIIDVIRTEIQYQTGKTEITYDYLSKLSYESGVSVTTLHNWLFGETRRPQGLSQRFVLEALRVHIKYFREDGSEVMWGHNSRRGRGKR